jgi:uncharacterized repeat protein (TIGR04052 family)
MIHGSQIGAAHAHTTEEVKGFPIHIGSTGCQAESPSQKPTSCAQPNLSRISLEGFDPTQHQIVADLAALVSSTQLNHNQAKTAPGCMSAPDDGDCTEIFKSLGLNVGGKPTTGQTFFRIQ